MFIDFHRFHGLGESSLSYIHLEPWGLAFCGILWHPVAGCGGLWRPVASCGGICRVSRSPIRRSHPGGLESWILETWRPGGKDDEADGEDAHE